MQRWADVQLVAVIPQRHHPPGTYPPFPAHTVTPEVLPCFDSSSVEPWHASEHMLSSSVYPLLFRFGFGPYFDTRVTACLGMRDPREYQRTRAIKAGKRGARHADEYRQWLALTRALADDEGIAFSSEHQTSMQEAAGAVERAVGSGPKAT